MSALYILDTDHISLLQRQNTIVISHLQQVPVEERAVTAVTVAEQCQGRLAAFHRAKSERDASRALALLMQTVQFYRTIQVLPYNPSAVAQFEQLRRQKIRIGTQDLRIAAIVLSHGATVVTRNMRDFRQVPGLIMTDWSQP